MGVEGSKGESRPEEGESVDSTGGGRGDFGLGGKARRDCSVDSRREGASVKAI